MPFARTLDLQLSTTVKSPPTSLVQDGIYTRSGKTVRLSDVSTMLLLKCWSDCVFSRLFNEIVQYFRHGPFFRIFLPCPPPLLPLSHYLSVPLSGQVRVQDQLWYLVFVCCLFWSVVVLRVILLVTVQAYLTSLGYLLTYLLVCIRMSVCRVCVCVGGGRVCACVRACAIIFAFVCVCVCEIYIYPAWI